MALMELEFTLERAQELPIRHLSLLGRRKQIKAAYVEAMELLDKHKQQGMPADQEEIPQGVKRKRWVLCSKNMSFTSSFAQLSTDNVRRFEWYADCAGRFLRDLESGCSLHHYTFCNPIVRYLLEGKTLRPYFMEQGHLRQGIFIWPTYSDERGVEALLAYRYDDSTLSEKNFTLVLLLRLSESTDIVGVAIKGLRLLTSEFKIAAEFAMGELTKLSSLQDIAQSYGPPWVGIQDWHIKYTQYFRPNPACCNGSRHGLCANNNIWSELSDIFPEQVIFWNFQCYYVQPRSSCSSFDVVSRSNSRGGGKPPLLLTAGFAPHDTIGAQNNYAFEIIEDKKKYRDASIQQVAEALKSDAINGFFRQPGLTEYYMCWYSKHGAAQFWVEKVSMERIGGTKPRRRYNTRGS